MELEFRSFDQFELRDLGQGMPTLYGHAAVFGRDSEPIGGRFIERIAKGAFREALASKQDVRALVEHDPTKLLGRTGSGTLRLSEDETGLAVELPLPNTQIGRDTMEMIRRGDYRGMSFGFKVTRGGDSWDRSQPIAVRTVNRVAKLFEVTITAAPAYLDTSVALRSLDALLEEESLDAEEAIKREARLKKIRKIFLDRVAQKIEHR